MGKVAAEFTMTLDGFIADVQDNVRPIFGWYASGDTDFTVPESDMVFRVSQASADLLREEWVTLGAIVTGRHDFDVSRAWGGKTLMGIPMLIVTHHPPPEWDRPDSPFIFVTDGVESAIEQAKALAGDKTVGVGGSKITQQCLNAGLIDEIMIHLVPILLGDGIRLFDELDAAPVDLEIVKVVKAHDVTHLKYRVIR